MRKVVLAFISMVLMITLLTACGSKEEAAPADTKNVKAAMESAAAKAKETETTVAAATQAPIETVIVEKETKVKEIIKETYYLIEYEAGGMSMKSAQLEATGMADGTYVEMLSDGSGVVSIMGAANTITWDESGSMMMNGYPVYTFKRIDEDTIMLEQAGAKFIMSSAKPVVTDASSSNSDLSAAYGLGGGSGTDASTAEVEGTEVYHMYSYEAMDDVKEDILLFGDMFKRTFIELKDDGTGYMSFLGNSGPIDWNSYEIDGPGATYTIEKLEDGMLDISLFGLMTIHLTSKGDIYTMAAEIQEGVPVREGLKTADHSSYDGKFGPAGYLNSKRTVLVPIFLTDRTREWTDSEKDQETMENIWKEFSVTAYFLRTQCADYGYDVDIIWDWKKHPELLKYATYPCNIDEGEASPDTLYRYSGYDEEGKSTYSRLSDICDSTVDINALKKKFNADNVCVYFIINDMPEVDVFAAATSFDPLELMTVNPIKASHAYRDCAFCDWSGAYGHEFGLLRAYQFGGEMVAHETLHMFGAPDLYLQGDESDDQRWVSNEYRIYIVENKIKEIMGDQGSYTYFGPNMPITPVTAYYTNLINEAPEDVIKFKLGKPEK